MCKSKRGRHTFNSQLQHHTSYLFDVSWAVRSSKPLWINTAVMWVRMWVVTNKALKLFQTAQTPQINSTSANLDCDQRPLPSVYMK